MVNNVCSSVINLLLGFSSVCSDVYIIGRNRIIISIVSVFFSGCENMKMLSCGIVCLIRLMLSLMSISMIVIGVVSFIIYLKIVLVCCMMKVCSIDEKLGLSELIGY